MEDDSLLVDEGDAISRQYQKTEKLGEGTYAVVYKGYHVERQDQPIAIKKIRIGLFKEGLDMSAIREIKFLQEISHPNVIKVCSIKYKYKLLKGLE